MHNLFFIESSAHKFLNSLRNNKDMIAASLSSDKITNQDSSILKIQNNIATIDIKGILTQNVDIFAYFFGGNTTYKEIQDALVEANDNIYITDIILNIESPGGEVDGLFDTIALLQSIKKRKTARVNNLAASAAYALATQTDKIVVNNRAARVGSVGTAVTIYVDEDEVAIASTDAPKKRPDVTTAAGIAVVRETLDALEVLFVDAIAAGRKTTADNVTANFGQGAVILADEALNRGMIDGIENVFINNKKEGIRNMNLKELKIQHSDLYDEIVAEGAKQERDRVCAHLVMGTESGDMQTAIEAIKNGDNMTSSLTAKYQSALIKKNALLARNDDKIEAVEIEQNDKIVNKESSKIADEATKLEQMYGLGGIK